MFLYRFFLFPLFFALAAMPATGQTNVAFGGIKADPGASPMASGGSAGAVTPAANLLEQPESMDVEGGSGVPAVTPASAPVA